MASDLGGGGSPALTMAIYAALTYDVISATNSSPQTTEINAAARAETLMKWPPALGAGLAGVLLWVQYVYARNCGVRSQGAPTESYGEQRGPMQRGPQFRPGWR